MNATFAIVDLTSNMALRNFRESGTLVEQPERNRYILYTKDGSRVIPLRGWRAEIYIDGADEPVTIESKPER